MTLLELTDVTAFYGPVQVLDTRLAQPFPRAAPSASWAPTAPARPRRCGRSAARSARGAASRSTGRACGASAPSRSPPAASRTCPRAGERSASSRCARTSASAPTAARTRASASDVDYCLDLFPQLKERIGSTASTLSGGEQQMLAIARAFMAKPRLLMLDEASLGLAPSTGKAVYEAIRRLRLDSGIAMLVVEQNANLAFTLVDTATVLETGRNVLTGTSAELKGMDEIRRAYLGG